MYKNIIGAKRAKEIVKQMLDAVNESNSRLNNPTNIKMPTCELFVQFDGVKYLLGAYKEVREYANREGGFKFPYDDSVRLTDYVKNLSFSKEQLQLLEEYDIETLKRFSKEFFVKV